MVEHQGHPADFGDAHRRHWQDAELLLQHERWANADQLYGLSAECGLKAVMRSSGEIKVDSKGVPTLREHRQHVKELWSKFATFVQGLEGRRYLLPPGDPFADWSITDRYAHSRHFDRAGVLPHRLAACAVRRMVQRAQQDGVR